MDDSWRFRPIQSNICPICSISHFPFCPPPPAFDRIAYNAIEIHRRFPPPDLNPPSPFHRPIPDPSPFLDFRTAPPMPPFRDHRFRNDEFLEMEGFRKRMRVQDPNPLPDRTSWDDERRLNLIRDHGIDHCSNYQASAFDSYRNFQEITRLQSIDRVLSTERKGYYGGEVDNVRNGSFSSQFGEQVFARNDFVERSENYTRQAPNERVFHDSQIPASYCTPDRQQIYLDRQLYPTESSSYSLPKQSQYPRFETHQMMPKVANIGDECPDQAYGTMRQPLENKFELRNLHNEFKTPVPVEFQKPFQPQAYHGNDYRIASSVMDYVHNSQTYPPLPPKPPLPPPPEPSPPHFQITPPVPTQPPKLSPMPDSISAPLFPTPCNQSSSEPRPLRQASFYNETPACTSNGVVTVGLPFIHQTTSKEYLEERGQTFPVRHSLKDKPTVIDACHLFRQPHRASRPDHIVIILRGLPGSGKSYWAKALRDLEVETGGNAPRIHAMDDYFMIEVEKKVEDNESSKSSSSSRGKKQITKKVIEYCYEPEMEEAYRSSMLKAFKKTLDEGNFTFIIVDDRNLRVADFAQFWAIAKRSGYEVYLLEATYKDPTGCAARNVHGFTVEDIQKMAEQWEEAPSLYLQLDIQSLFLGDDLNEQSIHEVDMDTDDAACDEEQTHKYHAFNGDFAKIGERWNTDEDDDKEEEPTGVKEIGNSKWSKDVDEDIENSDGAGGNLSALSGLIQAYGKGEKSVHWGDQVGQSGFSIGAVKKQSRSSLLIGPGSGYNLDSNPLREDDDALEATGRSNINESKRRFTEQIRAERESFKAVFDRRRQRIGGLGDAEDE